MKHESTNAMVALLLSVVVSPAAALSIDAKQAIPGSEGAAEPSVAAHNTRGWFVTWLDATPALRVQRAEVDDEATLAFAARGTVAEGRTLLANWADFPSLVQLRNGDLVAQFPTRGEARHATNLELARSSDEGRTWSKPLRLNRDGIAAEHGFATLLPLDDDELTVAWLDGRNTGGSHEDGHRGAMSLRAARFARLDRRDEVEVDARTCDCCQTDSAATARGHVVVYRDREVNEVRDIVVARYEHGRYQPAAVVHRDAWKMPGCPVNGPAIAATRNRVVVAWYTGADDAPRVQLAQSLDGGRTFAAPIEVDRDVVGRVDLAVTDGGRVVVSWLANAGDATELRVAAYDEALAPRGRALVTRLEAGRSTGFPRLAAQDAHALLAWTAPHDGSTHIEVALLRVD